MPLPTSLYLSPDEAGAAGSGREHRVAPRVSCSLPISVVVRGEDLSTEIRDISASGVAVRLARDVELGEVYLLNFALPEEPQAPIRCAGLVRSVRAGESGSVVGLEFHKLEPDDRRRVADYVHQVRAGSSPAVGRPHWGGSADLEGATLVLQGGDSRAVLRWAPGLPSLFDEVAHHIGTHETVFVPGDHAGLAEGDRLFLEVVPPSSHAVFRMLVEVVWVESEGEGSVADIVIVDDSGEDDGAAPTAPTDDELAAGRGGIGVKLGGLTALDRYLLRAVRGFLKAEAERYR